MNATLLYTNMHTHVPIENSTQLCGHIYLHLFILLQFILKTWSASQTFEVATMLAVSVLLKVAFVASAGTHSVHTAMKLLMI